MEKLGVYFVYHGEVEDANISSISGAFSDLNANVDKVKSVFLDIVNGDKDGILSSEVKAGNLVPHESGFFLDKYVGGRLIKENQVAGYADHMNIISKIAESSDSLALVIEGDVNVLDIVEFKQTIEHVAKNMGEYELCNIGMIASQQQMFPKLSEISSINIYPANVVVWGYQCYFISKSGAKKILANCRPMTSPCDEMWGRIEGMKRGIALSSKHSIDINSSNEKYAPEKSVFAHYKAV